MSHKGKEKVTYPMSIENAQVQPLRDRNIGIVIRDERDQNVIHTHEDAFPVLKEIKLDEDSEILRDGLVRKRYPQRLGFLDIHGGMEYNEESDHNGEELDEDLKTPTTKASVEECNTSGKKNDHNGEELDEDLETPTKEECGTIGPSGKENEHNGEQG